MQFYSSLEQGFSPFVAHQNHLGNLKSRCLDVPPPSILIELIYIGASFKDSPGDCYVKLGFIKKELLLLTLIFKACLCNKRIFPLKLCKFAVNW